MRLDHLLSMEHPVLDRVPESKVGASGDSTLSSFEGITSIITYHTMGA